PVQVVLALPHELRVEGWVAGIEEALGLLYRRGDEVVCVGGREVRPLVGVDDRLHRGRPGRCGRLLAGWHQRPPAVKGMAAPKPASRSMAASRTAPAVAMSRISLYAQRP